jgi:hypothetical protein
VNPILAAALETQGLFVERGWRFCLIGGLAVQRWGEPRLTQDVDVTLLTGFGSEAPYVDAILEQFEGRLPDARAFALRHRVLLVRSPAGVPIDVALGAMPFEERAVERATDHRYAPGVVLRTCSAEDLVVMKAFAGRDQDWLDIQGVVLRQAGRLDTAAVMRELEPLLTLEEDPTAGVRLRALLEEARGL